MAEFQSGSSVCNKQSSFTLNETMWLVAALRTLQAFRF